MLQTNPHRSPNMRSRTSKQISSKGMVSKRTVLNCIVDDSALLAGITDTSRASIPAWLEGRFINVFVPLYTLEKLNSLKFRSEMTSNDAQATLEWLDTITTKTESRKRGRVELQGPEDQYETWEEVEKYLLPDTPLASQNQKTGVDVIAGIFDNTLNLDTSSSRKPNDLEHIPRSASSSTARSSKSSPIITNFETGDSLEKVAGDVTTPDGTGSDHVENGSHGQINGPTSAPVRALLNYVVWRTHHETSLAPGHYLLLTNDSITQQQAKKFGIRAKSVEQLRTVIARDISKHGRPRSSTGSDIQQSEDPINEEEEEIVFQGSHRHSSSQSSNTPDVWDPDQFGRGPNPKNGAVKGVVEPSNGPPGNSSKRRSRGNARGTNASQRRGSRRPSDDQQTRQQYTRPIDPDSYDRSGPSARRGVSAAHRRLWEPN